MTDDAERRRLHNIPPDSPLVWNDIEAFYVRPERDWMIRELSRMNITDQTNAVVSSCAAEICLLITLMKLSDRPPLSLKGNTQRGFRSRRVWPSRRGPKKELEKLAEAARSGVMSKWLKAWGAATRETQDMVWKFPIPPIVNGRRGPADLTGCVGVDGLFICPRPELVLAAIEHALESHEPSRGKKSNDHADEIAAAIKKAARAMTGRTYTTDKVGKEGPAVGLADAVERHFGIAGIRHRLFK